MDLMKTGKKIIISMAAIAIAGCSMFAKQEDDTRAASGANTKYFCAAYPTWITDAANPPIEIPGGGKTLCEFYQFSWQWFISLMDAPGGSQRAYQNPATYPVFLGSGKNSCADNPTSSKLFVRTGKDDNVSAEDFTAPSEMNQALDNAVIYDQNGNIVLYEARFDRNMCNLPPGSRTLPAGTTEIKSSWRTISENEKADYVWITSDTNNNGRHEDSELYGMVGFHLVNSTKLHPEFIWATFEHKSNAPDCQGKASGSRSGDWSFTSKRCAEQLPDASTANCSFNKTLDPKKTDDSPLTGTPTEICRVYANATAPGDNQARTNSGNIVSINAQLTGIFSALPGTSSLRVLKNYKIVGALWLSDIAKKSSRKSNQRGSIQLANTTMETNAQQGFGELEYISPANLEPAANCFDCHGYKGPGRNAHVSHIFSKIRGGD